MKKVFYSLLAFCASTSMVLAQVPLRDESNDEAVALPYFEGFSNTLDGSWPAGWSTVDADEDGYNWKMDKIFPEDDLSYKRARSESWNPEPEGITPGNWLISPNIMGAKKLDYTIGASHMFAFAEYYSVLVSSTSRDIDAFKEIFAEELSETESNFNYFSAEMHPRSIQLPEGTKYVAFRHHNCYNQYCLLLDDLHFQDKDTSIENVELAGLKLSSQLGTLVLDIPASAESASIEIYSLNGSRVVEEAAKVGINYISLASGVYIVRIADFSAKVLIP